jgi:hypothetical protein
MPDHPASFPRTSVGEGRPNACLSPIFDWLGGDARRQPLLPTVEDMAATRPVRGAPTEVYALTPCVLNCPACGAFLEKKTCPDCRGRLNASLERTRKEIAAPAWAGGAATAYVRERWRPRCRLAIARIRLASRIQRTLTITKVDECVQHFLHTANSDLRGAPVRALPHAGLPSGTADLTFRNTLISLLSITTNLLRTARKHQCSRRLVTQPTPT